MQLTITNVVELTCCQLTALAAHARECGFDYDGTASEEELARRCLQGTAAGKVEDLLDFLDDEEEAIQAAGVCTEGNS